MRFLKRLTCFTAAVFAIFCMLSAIYVFRPDTADNIGTFLYPNQERSEMTAGGNDLQKETASLPDENIEKEETGQKAEEYETDVMEPLKNNGIAESAVSDYILPEQSEIVVPENVLGRNGYQQIQGNGEQIDDEAAK